MSNNKSPGNPGRTAKVKLNLQDKSDPELDQFATDHIAAMTGNANFATPNPAAPAFLTLSNNFHAALTNSNTANQTAKEMTVLKETARTALEAGLTQRGTYVEETSSGDEAKILSAGLAVRAPSAPIGPLPAPQNVTATGGDLEGTADCQCDPVKGRDTYIGECASSATGPWTQVYVGKKSSFTATGLVSGQMYYFRMRAVGAAGPGPWSDLAQKRAT
ncbi:MAG: fibronectin type III domain-containing protein [Verrucomicrobia bacterium]|nr:fibronectin type III domain-containing protein [Verrucomicrobiota bacterium]